MFLMFGRMCRNFGGFCVYASTLSSKAIPFRLLTPTVSRLTMRRGFFHHGAGARGEGMKNIRIGEHQSPCTRSRDCCTDTIASLAFPVDVARERCSGIVALVKITWASPWSLCGAGVGVLGLLTGGGVRRVGRIVEFWSGLIPLVLRYCPFIAGSPVATFGHVVVGRSKRHLDACRPHQMVHVRQYECWGPLFVPMYLLYWFVLWFQGKHPYYDNPFEREAYDSTS